MNYFVVFCVAQGGKIKKIKKIKKGKVRSSSNSASAVHDVCAAGRGARNQGVTANKKNEGKKMKMRNKTDEMVQSSEEYKVLRKYGK